LTNASTLRTLPFPAGFAGHQKWFRQPGKMVSSATQLRNQFTPSRAFVNATALDGAGVWKNSGAGCVSRSTVTPKTKSYIRAIR